MLTDDSIMRLARATLDQGLCFDRKKHITRATDGELISFAHALINEHISLVAERLAIHQAATRQVAQLRASINGGVSNLTLGELTRFVLTKDQDRTTN